MWVYSKPVKIILRWDKTGLAISKRSCFLKFMGEQLGIKQEGVQYII